MSAESDKAAWPTSDLPTGWGWTKLDEAFADCTSSEKKLPQKDYASTGRLPVVDQGASEVGGYTDDDSLAYEGPLPALVFGDHTRCVKYVSEPFVQGADGVRVLAPGDHYHPRFAYWMLKAAELPNKGYSRHFKFLKASRFPIAPLNEQRRIVAKIEALTARSRRAKEALDAIPPLLDKLRQSILAAAFRGDLTAAWRAQHPDVEPATELLKRIRTERRKRWEEAELAKMKAKGKVPGDDRWKERYEEPAEDRSWTVSEPPSVPVVSGYVDAPALNGWTWVRLLDVARLESGHTPRKSVPEYWKHGDVPWICLQDIRAAHGLVIQDTKYKPTMVGIENSAARLLPAGTVVFSRDISVGFATIMGRPMATTQHFANWVCRDFLRPKFLMFALMASRDALIRGGEGTTVKTIYFPALERFSVLLPPLAEQDAIVDRVQAALSRVARLQARMRGDASSLDALDSAILAKAFRGELVPQDPNDEPASVLLERIRTEKGHQSNQKRRKSG